MTSIVQLETVLVGIDNSLVKVGAMESVQQHLLDLSYLTEEERERLVAVIKADEELRIRDRIRLG